MRNKDRTAFLLMPWAQEIKAGLYFLGCPQTDQKKNRTTISVAFLEHNIEEFMFPMIH